MWRAIVVAALCLSLPATGLAADPYPTKPVRIIVPYSPGGSTDLTARIVGQHLTEALGQPFVVENRTGAGSVIGSSAVAKAAPDGYTLLMADQSLVLAPSLYKSVPFDVQKDFTPITEIIRIPVVLVVNPSLGISTLEDLVKYARANPGKLNYGSAGIGGAIHLASELFNKAANVDITHVPYSGGGGAMMNGVVGNHVQVVITAVPTVLPFVQSGKLKALAIATADGKRSPVLPDVPSMSEAGVKGMEVYFWYGLAGPARLPREVVDTLHAAVKKSLSNPKAREQFLAQGAEIIGSSPEEFEKHFSSEYRRWNAVIKAAGIKPE